MSAVAAAVLEPVGQARVALQGVAVEARLQGLLSEVTVTQTYRNLEDTNIEATYTFPLPPDAVLLEPTLELNGRQLQGVVQPRAAAEERYEGAIDDGDTAVLLQQIEPGTFSMNLGNLLAGESAVIRFRYAHAAPLAGRPTALPPADHHRAAVRRPAGGGVCPAPGAGARPDGGPRVHPEAGGRRAARTTRQAGPGPRGSP